MTSEARTASGGRGARPGGLPLVGTLERIAGHMLRYGLVLVLAWIGAMKFTRVEAKAIQPLVANSPFLAWIYGLLSVEATSALIGAAELAIAALIAVRPLSARAAMAGSGLAVGMFLTTSSFLVSTPGAFQGSLGGFPALSVVPGQFLLKDLVLLAAALWSLAEEWKAGSAGASPCLGRRRALRPWETR